MQLNIEGFTHVSQLDLNMGYYHIKLCPGAKQLCTILIPWGEYEYQNYIWGSETAPMYSMKVYPNYFRGLVWYVCAQMIDCSQLKKSWNT